MTGYVYAIADAQGSVKLGYTKNPTLRLESLQISRPDKLRILGVIPGDRRDEANLHTRFSAYRCSGEWFRHEGVVSDFVSSMEPWHVEPVVVVTKVDPNEHPLRAWRAANNMTLMQLAERVGVGQPTLSDIETWRRPPSLSLALRLEEVTGITPRNLARRPPSP